MNSESRSRILARVRHASRGATAGTVTAELEALGSAPVAALPCAETGIAFLANVLKNKGSVDCARSRSEAVKAVGHYLLDHFRSQRLVAGNDPRLAAMPWRDAGLLPRFGAAGAGDPVAVSYARLAVAEMGAVVLFTGKSNPAANNLLAEHHIVLCHTDDLVAYPEEAWEQIAKITQKEGRPRGINFIAGPSSTADVEGNLVYGAHGPRHWHIILLGEVNASWVAEARELADPAGAASS